MKRWSLILLVIALMVSTVPAALADDGVTYLNERFESGVDVFNSTAWGMTRLSGGHQGAGLRSTMKVGAHWGSSGWWYFVNHGFSRPDELYWRYWLKFDKDFYIQPPARGKLPGPATLNGEGCKGGVPTTTAKPCFSARMLFSRVYPSAGQPGYPDPGPPDKTLLGFYAYHLDSPSNRGDIWTWDTDTALLAHGQWYCVEGRIKLNTPGAHDGVLEGWVDGQPAFERTDIAFRRGNETSMHINSFWFDVYYGGNETSPVVNRIDFDSLALGSERMGCAETHTGKFFDDDNNTFESDIEWLAGKGITKGCNPPDNTMFCPNDPVTREVMAVYLARYLELPASPKDYFTDDAGSQFEDDINRMAHAGITKGCGDQSFCPRNVVDRGQMAAFLTRALRLTDAWGGNLFTDDDDSIFKHDIDRLAVAGITKGCNPPSNTKYCPKQPVSRGAMAAFIHRTDSR